MGNISIVKNNKFFFMRYAWCCNFEHVDNSANKEQIDQITDWNLLSLLKNQEAYWYLAFAGYPIFQYVSIVGSVVLGFISTKRGWIELFQLFIQGYRRYLLLGASC